MGSPTAIPSLTESRAQLGGPGIRQTDDDGLLLPFETEFPNRWSDNNNGTPYEPCTKVETGVLVASGLDPASAEDVAASDSQTARGCKWTFTDGSSSVLSQFVGNIIRPAEGLDGHKKANSGGITWLSDSEVSGRRVLRGSIMAAECGVYIRSGDAVVVTSVISFDPERPRTEEVCVRAENFLQKTIGAIPH